MSRCIILVSVEFEKFIHRIQIKYCCVSYGCVVHLWHFMVFQLPHTWLLESSTLRYVFANGQPKANTAIFTAACNHHSDKK